MVDEQARYLPNEDYYAWKFNSPTEMLTAIFRAEHFIQGNVCYSKALLDEVGGYDPELAMAEDLDLYVRFLLAGHLPVVCPHYSHLHRFHSANVSQVVDAAKHNADLRVIYDKYAGQLRALGIAAPGSYGRAGFTHCWGQLNWCGRQLADEQSGGYKGSVNFGEICAKVLFLLACRLPIIPSRCPPQRLPPWPTRWISGARWLSCVVL